MLRLIPANTKIDFIRGRWVGFGLSLILTLASFFLLADRGFNYGIDFAGGILMEIRTPEPVELAPLRKALSGMDIGEVSLQYFGDTREILIRIEINEEGSQAELIERTKTLLADTIGEVDYRKIDYVGPTVGQEMIESGVIALILAFVAIMLYVWFRFEWQFGVGAVLALLHDATMLAGFYALSGFEFGLTSIAAILTVIGYSINDSVVIYDRIRENLRKYKKMPIPELLNRSINETLSRTVITALTTLLASAALVTLGGEVLRGFSAALSFGVIIGTYSSIYISAPILLYFRVRTENPDATDTRPSAS